ncbi:PREDICTED: glutenin, high molecular weight subunit DX5-like isoform X2 [Trachymyrmex cornetzi]|uniref:glutenin, high molecular weight subunit DX5-like isoform X2 n=1 Tax=Trachymyrmex cornetzi TaxID=471704 RepID=UPI00084F7107|nr:PREDICTED: glutenin, high molecular weight subunit DX5-like isoform X2 [Trachymyrmex cornetzi]
MLKYIILFATVLYMVQSQRPWHAGTGNRLPQVLPQYIDERIAAEQATQAGQAGQAAQGDEIIPAGQGTQGILVGQGTQGIPLGQGAQGIPVGQGTQGIPIGQGAQGIPVGQGVQEIPVGQGTQGIPLGQGAQGIPVGQGTQGIPIGQGAQGTYQGSHIGTDSSLLGNRIGDEDSGFAAAAAPPLSTTINPADLPVDAHGDIDLVNRIKTWPRDKQPFWYINWQAIQAHRGDVNNTARPAQTQPNSRSFFAG